MATVEQLLEQIAAAGAAIDAAEQQRVQIERSDARQLEALRAEVPRLEQQRAVLAAAVVGSSPPELADIDARLAQLKPTLEQLEVFAQRRMQGWVNEAHLANIRALEVKRLTAEEQLRPLLAAHYAASRLDAQAALDRSMAAAQERLNQAQSRGGDAAGAGDNLDAELQRDVDAVVAAQERVRSCTRHIALAEREAFRGKINLDTLEHKQRWLQECARQKRCPTCPEQQALQCYVKVFGTAPAWNEDINTTQHRNQLNGAAEDTAVKLAAARRAYANRAAEDDNALLRLQAAHDEQLARLREQVAAPRRHPTARVVADAMGALRGAAAACNDALAACADDVNACAPTLERARAKLAAAERQHSAALATRERVEAGMAAVTAALAGADGMARKVAALLEERDAARAETAAVRAEAERAAAAARAAEAELQQRLAAMERELAAAHNSVNRAGAVVHGSADAQRTAMEALPPEELAALPGHLYRALDTAAKVTAARAVEQAAREAAAARRQAECVYCTDAPMDTVLLPCGHKCVCQRCAAALLNESAARRACPMCRSPLTGSVVPFEC